MDTIEEKKRKKREKARDRQRKCRAKKKKLKEDLLIKNYKNREAVKKHHSGIKHAGRRGSYDKGWRRDQRGLRRWVGTHKKKRQYGSKNNDGVPDGEIANIRSKKTLRYSDKNILHNPQLLGLSTTSCKSIIIPTKNGQQKIIYSDKDRTEYDFKNGKNNGPGKITYRDTVTFRVAYNKYKVFYGMITYIGSLRRQTLSRKKESAEVGRDLAMSMLNLANHHNSYSNKSYHINIFKPITA